MMFCKEDDFAETPIGDFPKEWRVVSLGDIAKVKGGKRVRKGEKLVDFKTGFPYIRVVDFKNGTVAASGVKYLLPETREKIKNYTISSDDVYISIAGTIGLAGLIPPELDGANLTENAAKLCDLGAVRKEFLAYLLNSEVPRGQIMGLVGKGTQPKLALFRIESLKIPLPSMGEQEKIAEILSVVDSAIGLVDRVIWKTERLKKGLIQELLTRGIGHKEHKFTKEVGYEIPTDWKVKAAKELFYIKGRIGWRGLKKAHFTNEGPYLITGVDFAEGRIKWENCFHIPMNKFLESPEIFVQKDDILVTKDGTIGKVAFVDDVPDGKASINAHLLLVRNLKNHDVHPMYTYYALQTSHFQNYAKLRQVGTTRAGLTQRAFEQFQFILPPLEEQRKILSILSTIDNEIRLEKNEKTLLERVKRSLMDLLLTGKVRVKVD